MSNEFQWFRDPRTGKEAQFPARFGERFGLVPVDPSGCTDCLVQPVPADTFQVVYDDDDLADLTEDED